MKYSIILTFAIFLCNLSLAAPNDVFDSEFCTDTPLSRDEALNIILGECVQTKI